MPSISESPTLRERRYLSKSRSVKDSLHYTTLYYIFIAVLRQQLKCVTLKTCFLFFYNKFLVYEARRLKLGTRRYTVYKQEKYLE